MPPGRMKANGCADQLQPPRDRQRRRLELVGRGAQDADRDTRSPSENAAWTHWASAPIAAGFRFVL